VFGLRAFSLFARFQRRRRRPELFTDELAEWEGLSCLNGCQGWRGTFLKRVLLGTLSCLVIVIALLALASRWAALFWLLVLSVGLYLLLGRKVEVEFRLGIHGGEERRVYGALIWKRQAAVAEDADARESVRLDAGAVGRDG
jgi:hypothetical protein